MLPETEVDRVVQAFRDLTAEEQSRRTHAVALRAFVLPCEQRIQGRATMDPSADALAPRRCSAGTQLRLLVEITRSARDLVASTDECPDDGVLDRSLALSRRPAPSLLSRWDGCEKRRQDHGDDQRPDVDRPCLPAHLRQLGRVADGLGARVHVALTARREPHSRLLPRLEHSRCAHPRWNEQG